MSKSKNIELIPIKNIVTKGLQSRASLSQRAIKDYAHDQKEGRKVYEETAENPNEDEFLTSKHNPLPPGIAYRDDSGKVFLAEGFHRCESHIENGFSVMPLDIRPGTKEDAIKHSAGANSDHGERRTTADKKHAVEMILDLKDCKQLSDNDIAKLVKVSPGFVAKCRPAAKKSEKSRGRPKKDGTPAQKKNGKTSESAPESPENGEEGLLEMETGETSGTESEAPKSKAKASKTQTLDDKTDRAAVRVKNVLPDDIGKAFYEDLTTGALKMTAKEVQAYADLNDGQIQRLYPLVVTQNLPVKKAMEYLDDENIADSICETLSLFCLAHGGKLEFPFASSTGDFVLVVTKD